MKILHVTPAYEPAWHLGGVVRSVTQCCRGLARLGLEVTVFTTDSGGARRMSVPLNQEVELDGVKVWYFKSDFTPRFGYSRRLKEACRQRIKQFDVVHLSSLWWYPEIATGSEALKQNVPYIISPTGGLTTYSLAQKPIKKRLFLKFWESRILNGSRAIHYTTALERDSSSSLKLRPPSFIIPGGIDLEEFRELPDKVSAKRKMNLPLDKPIILFFGRLHPVKNLGALLTAFAQILPQFGNLVLVLAGPDDGQETYLRNLASELLITDHIIFLGNIPPERRKYLLRSADLLALVSLHENLGNAAIEAMLAGVPVLVSENVGIAREVSDIGAGLVVSAEAESISQGLRELLSNPSKLDLMGQTALVSAPRRYGMEGVARQMALAYEDVRLGRRSPGLSWSD
jgi:glycosyltransferase involved in cell wall biosynthesis